MGFLDRLRGNKLKDAVQINTVSNITDGYFSCGWDGLLEGFKKGFRNYSDMYLYAALTQLYNGVSNITFEGTKGHDTITVRSINSFLENNVNAMLNQYLFEGFIAVQYTDDKHYRVLDKNLVKTDRFGQVANKNTVVIYAPSYQSKRKAPMDFIKPLMATIDNLSNTMLQSTDTMGVLPIISGDSIPANPQFKQELAEAMSKKYGWGPDQLKYYLARTELKVQTIDLKVKDLELRDNILATFKTLLNYLEVPVDLVVGNSTYNNVKEAKTYFYDTTVRKYAELFLKIGRALLTASNEYVPQSAMTYHLYNVSGLETTLSDMCAEKEAYIDVLKKLGESGIDVSEELAKVFADIKRQYIEV